MPLPLREEVCGLLAALSVTVSVPVNEPLVGGVNVTLMVQLAFLASLDGLMGQLLVCPKLPETAMLVMVKAVL